MVVMCGSTTVCVMAMARAASHAFPPWRSTSVPTQLAIGCELIATPFVPLTACFLPNRACSASFRTVVASIIVTMNCSFEVGIEPVQSQLPLEVALVRQTTSDNGVACTRKPNQLHGSPTYT